MLVSSKSIRDLAFLLWKLCSVRQVLHSCWRKYMEGEIYCYDPSIGLENDRVL